MDSVSVLLALISVEQKLLPKILGNFAFASCSKVDQLHLNIYIPSAEWRFIYKVSAVSARRHRVQRVVAHSCMT